MDNGPTTTTYEELWVLGPPLTDVDRTYNTLYALQYLPEHYKLILPGSHAADKSFLTDISDIVARDALTDRVRFAEKAPSDEPITLAVARLDSPEAIASSILGTAHGRL